MVDMSAAAAAAARSCGGGGVGGSSGTGASAASARLLHFRKLVLGVVGFRRRGGCTGNELASGE